MIAPFPRPAHVHVPRLVGLLVGRHSGLVPRVSSPPPDAIADWLLQGRLDIVISSVTGAGCINGPTVGRLAGSEMTKSTALSAV